LDAFNYIKYGAIDGVVENIYQDSVEDKDMGYVFLNELDVKEGKQTCTGVDVSMNKWTVHVKPIFQIRCLL
jgi:hypothetical protein